ncbi:Alpha/Beta hydrolase protein [Aspergillus californicus]
MPQRQIPSTGSRGQLNDSISSFLQQFPDLHLGGQEDFHDERRKHLNAFGIHSLPSDRVHPIHDVEFTAIRGPHGTIPIRVLYPSSGEAYRASNKAAGLIYFHGGGYTIGSVDEFENGLRLLAEASGVQIYAVEYRLSPEFRFPVQLDEYDAVIDALQGETGKARGVQTVLGGGDSAGGNMTAAIALRRKDDGKKPLDALVLLYPEARVPFDTPAAVENNSGYYLECNGIFSFADHYLPRGIPPSHRYVSPGMQGTDNLSDLSPAFVYTSGFDPLRDVGVEYACKLQKAGNQVVWRHYDDMTHGWLQMTAWSQTAQAAVKDVARDIKSLVYGHNSLT